MPEFLRQLLPGWPLGSIFEVAAVVGALLAVLGLLGRRQLSHPRCRRCGCDLRLALDDPANGLAARAGAGGSLALPCCPRCRGPLSRPWNIRWRPFPIRWRLVALGAVVVGAAVGVRALDIWRQQQGLSWSHMLPAYATMRTLHREMRRGGLSAVSPTTWEELIDREAERRLRDSEREQVVRAVESERIDDIEWRPPDSALVLLTAIHVNGGRTWRERTAPLITSASMRVAATDVDAIAAPSTALGRCASSMAELLFCHTWAPSAPESARSAPPPQVARASPLLRLHVFVQGPHESRIGNAAGRPGGEQWWTIWRVDQVTLDGRPLTEKPLLVDDGNLNAIVVDGEGRISGGLFNHTSGRVDLPLPADLAPGLHTLAIEGALAIVPQHLALGLSDERVALPPPSQWGDRTRIRSFRLERSFEVLDVPRGAAGAASSEGAGGES